MQIPKQKSEYFEAVLQLRNLSKEMLDMVAEEMGRRGVFASKENKEKEGIDLFISSNKSALQIGDKLQKKFGGELKKTRKHFSFDKKSGKPLYRVAVFFKAPDFGIGDVVKIDRKLVKVRHVGKNIVGSDIRTGKSVNIPLKKTKPKKLRVIKAVVSKRFPQLEVIHPETYQSVKVENPKRISKNKVSAVVDEGRVYIIT